MIEKLKEIEERYQTLSAEIIKPEVIADNKLYSKYTKEYNALEPIVAKYEEYKKYQKNLEEATQLLADPDLKQMAEEEIASCKQELERTTNELKILLLPKDENDDKNVIIEIRGGAGGEEASLFGGVLMRMYLKYAERRRWKVELISVNETELGGVKEAVFKINGKGAYSDLKFESGVHRVQRVPETESQGRIHTSTATVAVLPEQEDIDMNIDEKDLKIDICRASGAGGQHVNTTDSAVRMVHIPTGLMVYCQDGRSQLKNRELALSILKSKVYDYYKTQSDSAYAENRKNQVGTGDRSERIRTYNYPQSRLTDHRINYTSYSLDAFLNGELDDLIDALKIAEREYKLSHSE